MTIFLLVFWGILLLVAMVAWFVYLLRHPDLAKLIDATVKLEDAKYRLKHPKKTVITTRRRWFFFVWWH